MHELTIRLVKFIHLKFSIPIIFLWPLMQVIMPVSISDYIRLIIEVKRQQHEIEILLK